MAFERPPAPPRALRPARHPASPDGPRPRHPASSDPRVALLRHGSRVLAQHPPVTTLGATEFLPRDTRRCGPPVDGVHYQRQRPTWLQHVVHRLGNTGFVRPVERQAEGNYSVLSRCRPRELLGESLDPADVGHALFARGPATFSEHCWIGIEANRALEQVGESEGEDAGPAADVEEPSGPIEGEVGGENGLELGE